MRLNRLLWTVGLAVLPSLLSAQSPSFTGHYPVGAEGIKAASLPPPGIYLRDYNIMKFANQVPGTPLDDVEVFAYVNAPRLIWMTDFKILGANYGMDAIVPFGYVDYDFKAGPAKISDDYFGLGDIEVEPLLLAWHLKQFDFAVGYAIWAPTGDYEAGRPDPIWKGFWSHMLTAGGTWFLDTNKTWAISVLNRYEIHHEHEDFPITPGQTYSLEWGVSKSIAKAFDVGLVGYYQQQTTLDSGPNSSDTRDRLFAAGAEISTVIPKVNLLASFRYLREFEAKEQAEGNLFSLTITKRF